MHELLSFTRGRPLLCCCASFLTVSLLLRDAGLPARLAAAGLFAALFIVLKFIRPYLSALSAPAFFACFAALVSTVYFSFYSDGVLTRLDGKTSVIEAVVLDTTYSTVYCTCLDVLVLSTDAGTLPFKAKLTLPWAAELEASGRLTGAVTFSAHEEYSFGFPERMYYASKGFILSCEAVEDAEVVYAPSTGFSPLAAIHKLRKFCSDALGGRLGKDSAGFASALLLGERDGLNAALKRDFSRLGLSHMLSVSGMHLTIILGGVSRLLRLLGLDRRRSAAAMVPLALFYAALTGFAPPIARSALMFVIYNTALVSGRQSDPPTSLFLSVFLICLVNPAAIGDVGLLLSFACTLGLTTLGARLTRNIRRRLSGKGRFGRSIGALLSGAALTLSAVLFSLPVNWLYFGYFSPWSPLTNLIYALPVTLILALSPFVILLGFLPAAAGAAAAAVELLYRLISFTTDWAAALPGTTVSLGYGFVKYIFVVSAAVLAVLYLLKLRKPEYRAAVFCSSAVSFAVCLAAYGAATDGDVRIAFVSRDKNDCIVALSEGKLLLCDLTDGAFPLVSASADVAASEFHLFELDTYMLTHYSRGHLSAVPRLCGAVRVDRLLLPLPENDDDRYISAQLSDKAGEADVSVEFYKRGAESGLRFGDFSIATSPFALLERSNLEVQAVSFASPGGRVLYAGASFYDSAAAGFCVSREKESDVMIFGSNGPRVKFSPLTGDEWPSLTSIIYTSDELRERVSTEFPAETAEITLGGRRYYTCMTMKGESE